MFYIICECVCVWELCSFSNLSVTSPTSKLIIQPLRRFTYVTVHSLTLPLLHLRHSSFSNPSFASPPSQDLQLMHLVGLHALQWEYLYLHFSPLPNTRNFPKRGTYNYGMFTRYTEIHTKRVTSQIHLLLTLGMKRNFCFQGFLQYKDWCSVV